MRSTLKIVLCALGLGILMPANAERLGRLFFTPAQRAQLEHDKLQNAGYGDDRSVLTVNGIVQKHGGVRTVWLNGVPRADSSGGDRAPESLLIAVPGQSHPVKIKVGQKVLINPPVSERPVLSGQ